MLQNVFLEKKTKKYSFLMPSKEFILFNVSNSTQPLNFRRLTKIIGIYKIKQIEIFRNLLKEMEKDGQLILTKKKYYISSKKLKFLQGKVIGHRDGFGFLRIKDEKDDYYLSSEQMKIVIHGDIVIAKPCYFNGRRKNEAYIVHILIPQNNQIVGRFFTKKNKFFVVPNDHRFNFKIIIPKKLINNAKNGLIVSIKLIQRQTKYKKAIGKVVEILGNVIDSNVAINIALRTYNISNKWPVDVQEQIKNIKKEIPKEIRNEYVDLRTLPLVTIDNKNSFDFDDAIYCIERKNKKGWHLWVAISDVSYYVRPKTPLDKEAFKRSTSIYFPSKVIPMLPEILSNDLCSLNPKMDKLCLVCEMYISNRGKISSYKFYNAIIYPHARLTYNEVQKIIQQNKNLKNFYHPFFELFTHLYNMYKILEKSKLKRGSIIFESEEVDFILNNKNRVKQILPIKKNEANKIIEECMILTNISATKFIEENKKPILYRVHNKPNINQILSLKTIFNKFGLNVKNGNNLNSRDYFNVLNKISNKPYYGMLQTILLKSMRPAIYNPINNGHFGLALSSYTHFTSPIRRYPDLLLHRIIKYIIVNKQKKIEKKNIYIGEYKYNLKEMLKFGEQCSINERLSDEATKNVITWLKCDFIKNYIGKIFNGIIVNITKFGFFVRLDKILIDGLVHISSLNDDNYYYDNIYQVIIGKLNKISFFLGKNVKIKVKNVNTETRKIDFLLISNNINI